MMIAFGALSLYLAGNDSIALWDRDEPRYAMTARYMLETGDWVVPHIGWGTDPDTWRTAKPVFIYWCQAGSMALFGKTAFAARLPSAVAMAMVVWLTGWGLIRLAGARVALWTAGILATSGLVIAAGKLAITDAVQLLFITAAQGCLFTIYGRRRPDPLSRGRLAPVLASVKDGAEARHPRDRGIAAIVLWIAIGLAGLTKGPVGLGVVATTMIALLLIDWPSMGFRRAIAWWPRVRPLWGVAIVALIIGPWLWMLEHRAPGFLRHMVLHDVVERSRSALEGHKGPPGFYLATIWGTFFPWCLFIPLAIGLAIKMRRAPRVRFALAAIVGPWLMMEIVQTKLVHYVLPIFPPLAFLTAHALTRCFRGKHDDLLRPLARVGAGVWALAAIALGLAPWLAVGRFDDLPLVAMAIVGAGGIAWGVGVGWLFMRRRPRDAAVVMGFGMAVMVFLLLTILIPRLDFLRLSPRLAFVLPRGDEAARGDIRMMGYKEQTLAFYQGGTIDDAPDNFLAITPPADWPKWLVIQRDLWDRLPGNQTHAYTDLFAFTGLNYAGGGKTVEVLIAVKRDRDDGLRRWGTLSPDEHPPRHPPK